MKYYCELPWKHITIRPNGDILPCCRFRGEKYGNINNGFDFINDKNINHMRQLTLGDKEIPGCNKCYFQEKNNIHSMRSLFSDLSNPLTKPKLTYLEIAFSNHCNLKCRMCNSYFSSKWIEDEIKLGIKKSYPQTLLTNKFDFDINSLSHIKVLGGEPFLSKEFKKKCLELTEYNNLILEIITNGTLPIPNEIISISDKLKNLKIEVSLDGIFGLNNYIRSGSDFNIIDQNIIEYSNFLQNRNFKKLTIHICVMIYNINLIPKIYDYLIDRYDLERISIDIVYNPKELNIVNLPKNIKSKINDLYNIEITTNPNNVRRTELFNKILKYLNCEPLMDFDKVIEYHNELNKIRNEKLGDLNPLISNILNED